MTKKNNTRKNFKIIRASVIILAVGTSWVFSEWLFFVTKPSFMSLYSPLEKASVLSSTALIMSTALLLASVPFLILGWLLKRRMSHRVLVSAVIFLPATLLLVMAMLVAIDNFTLTLLSWGIRNSADFSIYLYRLVMIGLAIFALWVLHGLQYGRYSDNALKAMSLVTGLILASSLPLLLMTNPEPGVQSLSSMKTESGLPNILILSGDGISASHMSLYGFERPTTPFMDSVRDEFLIAENYFSNASETGGSVISMLTGKLPTTTKVIYPPDVLRGNDSYQHLPGLLRQLGYYSADVSMRHYADPYDLNLRNGFAEANLRKLKDTGGALVTTLRNYPALNPTSLLTDRISERLSGRFGHTWKNKKMRDPLAEVNVADKRWMLDDERVEEIRRFLDSAPRPFFLNVHMMGTHGETFKPSKRVYSNEENSGSLWDEDSYDDAIMDFDRYVEETYKLLRNRGLLENTLLIISSDHGFNHKVLDRLPLMLRLPGGEQIGSIGGNTQRLDIAPTILDTIGMEARDWMEGQSLLDNSVGTPSTRFIFATGSRGGKSAEGHIWQVKNPQPPWYSLGRLFLIHCNQGFVLQLATMEIKRRGISGSTLECEAPLPLEKARLIMQDHLREKGYSWE
jgi:arylsulfatase A-like enzyme